MERIVFSDINMDALSIGSNDLVLNVMACIQGVRNVVSTIPGTRPMKRAWGCNIERLNFEPVHPTEGAIAANEIYTKIKRYCEEVEVAHSDILVEPDYDLPGYRIRIMIGIPALRIKVPFSFTVNSLR